MSRYKDGSYLNQRPDWHTEDSPWKAENIMHMLEKNDILPNTICEVGCGAGEILNQLYTKFSDAVQFTGYDISPDAIKLTVNRANDRLHFHQRDILETNLDNPYDLILLMDVIEHIENIFDFLRGIQSKGQLFMFHIPLDLSVISVLRGHPLLRSRKEVGHIHYFTRELALELLDETGFEVIDHFFTTGSIDLPRKTMKSWMMRWPRVLLNTINQDLCSRLLGGFSLLVLAKSS